MRGRKRKIKPHFEPQDLVEATSASEPDSDYPYAIKRRYESGATGDNRDCDGRSHFVANPGQPEPQPQPEKV